MKRAAASAFVVLAVALLIAGCGGSGGSSSSTPTPKKATAPNAPAGSKVVACGDGSAQLRATEVDCATALTTMERWEGSGACAVAAGGSRGSCSLGAFRCQAVEAERSIAVSCAGPEGDVAFIVRPGG